VDPGIPSTRRRDFLRAGAATALLPAFGWPHIPLTRPDAAPARSYYKFVFDCRVPAACALAHTDRQLHLITHAIDGDVTALWFHDLDLRWQQGPAAIAGVTRPGALFCLDLLARDRGMRLRRCIEHRLAADGRLSPEMPDLPLWTLAASPVQAPVPPLVEDPRRLLSWVIAPKHFD
jgi:hypothetical protein